MSEEEFAAAIYPLLRVIAKRLSRQILHCIPADDLAQTGMIGAILAFRRNPEASMREFAMAARCDMLDHMRTDLRRGKRKEQFYALTERLAISHDRQNVKTLNREIDGRRAIELLQLCPHGDVAMRWLQGESLAAIGRANGVHETAIYKRKTQAIRLVALHLNVGHVGR